MRDGSIACEQCRLVAFKQKVKMPNGRVLLLCADCHDNDHVRARIAEANAAGASPPQRANMYANMEQVKAMQSLKRGAGPDQRNRSPSPPPVPQDAPASMQLSDSFFQSKFKSSPFVQRRIKKEEKKSRSYIIGARKNVLGRDKSAAAAQSNSDRIQGTGTSTAPKKNKTFIVPAAPQQQQRTDDDQIQY